MQMKNSESLMRGIDKKKPMQHWKGISKNTPFPFHLELESNETKCLCYSCVKNMHAWILDLIRYYFRNTHILNTRPGKCVIAKVSFFKVFKKKEEVIALRIIIGI